MSSIKHSLSLNFSTTNLPAGTSTHDFQISFPSLELDRNHEYEIALTSYNIWYSWYNVSSTLGNNQFDYNDGTGNVTYTIANGQYSVSQLNSAMRALVVANGKTPDFNFVANYSTLKVDLSIGAGHTIAWTASSCIYTLFGFTAPLTYTGATTASSQTQPNISNGVDAINITTDLIDTRSNILNDKWSNVIYQVTPQVGPGSLISANIANPIYLPLNTLGNIHSARFTITDQNGNILDLNGETVSLSFHIKEHVSMVEIYRGP